MTTISAAIVVHDEEALIERCLHSLEGVVDEIVLVHDGPCSDRTLEIAARHGAKITVADFVGEADPHRPLAFGLATGDWILRIDADEYLSDGLRAGIRGLVETPNVDGWELLWPVWSQTKGRYVTRNGPHKRALTRRSASLRSGLIGEATVVRGPVARTDLLLEHRPDHDGFRLSIVLPKWRRWARIQARQNLGDWNEIPRFGYPPEGDWPARRRWGNRLSPLLIPVYGILEFVAHLRRLRRMRPVWQIVRVSAYWGLYTMIVQTYIARYRYFP